MEDIVIVNLKTFKGECERVDRSSILGNPFHIGKDGTREEVIEKYRVRLWRELKHGNFEITTELERLLWNWIDNGILILGCWCVPKPCHVEVIVNCLKWMKSRA